MRKTILIVAVLAAIVGCREVDTEKPIVDVLQKAVFETTSGEKIMADIDYYNQAVYIRHIPYGAMITDVNLVTHPDAVVETEYANLVGEWPVETDIDIICQGERIRYRFVLSDAVDNADEYLPAGDEWELVWAEEFNAPKLDEAVWGKCLRGNAPWSNKMSGSEDLTVIDEGHLILKARKNDNLAYDSSQYLTGGVYGKEKKSFKLGRIDVRAKVDYAQGFWPAIWLMPETNVPWPDAGEIDVMEHLNYADKVYQTVHSYYTENVDKDNPVSQRITEIDATEFAVYSVELYSDQIRFLINDRLTFTYSRDDTKDKQFPFSEYDYYLIFSAQLGGETGLGSRLEKIFLQR